MNFENLKRLVELQATIPISWPTAKSRCKGQRPIQSPVNIGGVLWREPFWGTGSKPGEGWGWGMQCLAQSFLRGIAPQYPPGRSQLDGRSGSKGSTAETGKWGRFTILA